MRRAIAGGAAPTETATPPKHSALSLSCPPDEWPAEITITVGAGLKRPQGSRKIVRPEYLATFFRELPCEHDGWWAAHVWTGDYRRRDAWQAASALLVDLDCQDRTREGGHQKHRPSQELRHRFAEAIEFSTVHGWHQTRHGWRLVVLLSEPVTDADLYASAARGLESIIDAWLDEAGLPRPEVGVPGISLDPVTGDRARIMRRPRCIVDDETLDSELHQELGASVVLQAEAHQQPRCFDFKRSYRASFWLRV